MTDQQREEWTKVYFAAMHLADAYEPWNIFREEDPFLFLMEDQQTLLCFSILSERTGQCGFACYVGDQAYAMARKRLFGPNPKKEPVFYLQDAIIGLWGDREDVSTANYRIIKELGIRCRGKGGWLHFETYETGSFPRPLNDRELELLASGLGNLFMMVKALHESDNLDIFQQGNFLLRTYDPESDLYRNQLHPQELLPTVLYPCYTVGEDPSLQALRDTPQRAYALELDWSFFPTSIKEGRKKFFPRMVLAADAASGFLFCSELLAPQEDVENALLCILDDLIDAHGKPKTLYLCEPELECRLSDFCKKIGLPIVMKKRLPKVTEARKHLFKDLM